MKDPDRVKNRIVVLTEDTSNEKNEKESSNKKLVIDGRIAIVSND
ncbi:hypothetical protein [Flexithrix dorotheae]|nr:hypothetical protein [Flexithrix dorotheae]